MTLLDLHQRLLIGKMLLLLVFTRIKQHHILFRIIYLSDLCGMYSTFRELEILCMKAFARKYKYDKHAAYGYLFIVEWCRFVREQHREDCGMYRNKLGKYFCWVFDKELDSIRAFREKYGIVL